MTLIDYIDILLASKHPIRVKKNQPKLKNTFGCDVAIIRTKPVNASTYNTKPLLPTTSFIGQKKNIKLTLPPTIHYFPTLFLFTTTQIKYSFLTRLLTPFNCMYWCNTAYGQGFWLVNINRIVSV